MSDAANPSKDAGAAPLSSWHDADFTNSDEVWPADWVDDERWMTGVGKKPFAPWGDPNDSEIACGNPDHDAATCAECDECDARWKWSHAKLWTTLAEARDYREMLPRPDGVVALIDSHEGEYTDTGDEYAFVDGDDIRCPETGEVHPDFLEILNRLGISYADISTSGTGVHVLYRGELPEAVTQANFEIDDEPWGDNEEVPSVEIYDQKHVCVVTGDHIVGTGAHIQRWDQDALEELLVDQLGEEALTDETGYDTEYEEASLELENYEPDATSSDEETSDIRDVLAAINKLTPADLNLDQLYAGEDSTGWSQWDPSVYRASKSKESLHSPDRSIFHDQKTGETFGVLGYFAAAHPDIDCAKPWRLQGEAWWRAVEEARQLGADIPAYIEEDSSQNKITTCAPPLVERDSLDVEARWDAMQGERYDAFLDHDAPTIWADEAGTGKTTNAAKAAYQRDRPHTVLFQQHAKAAEFLEDDATPPADEYYHMLGAEQKREECCRRAEWADDNRCPVHEQDVSACEHMCPVYDLDRDHPIRKLYGYLKRSLGPITAHVELREILPGHDDTCPWEDQFDDLEDESFVVGVHEYLQLRTVTDERDVIVDESPTTLQSNREISISELTQFRNATTAIAEDDDTEALHDELARFTDDIIDALTDPNASDTLADLEPPRIEDVYWRRLGKYERQNELDQRASEPHPVENFARAKLEYCETMLANVREAATDLAGGDDDSDLDPNLMPMLHDAIFAAAVEAGLSDDIGLAAAAAPAVLSACPTCGASLAEEDDHRVCTNDECTWTEDDDFIVPRLKYAEKARCIAYLATPADHGDDELALAMRSRPRPRTLPDEPLILNATARPEKVAAIWEVNRNEITVAGDDPVEANMKVTQLLDGQYHPGTVSDLESLQSRFQQAVDNLAAIYDKPLIVGSYDTVERATSWLDTPENATVLHFHAARGFNRDECDAVIVLGAPHPPVDKLQREAELLAVQNDGVRVGGTEHGPRDGAAGEPIWRKLDYEDDQGNGRAVQTKTYTGLVGTLFQEHREDELEQIVHRVRPVLAEETKHVHLLTNVPTRLPIDDVAHLDELTDGIRATLPVSDAALDLAQLIHHAADGDIPGVRPGMLLEKAGATLTSNPNPGRDGTVVELNRRVIHRLATMPATKAFVAGTDVDIDVEALDVSYKTISRWVDALEEVGLVSIGEYVHREGETLTIELSTLTSALEVLTTSEYVKVAVTRKLRRLLRESGSNAAWIAAARALFGLGDGSSAPEEDAAAASSGGGSG